MTTTFRLASLLLLCVAFGGPPGAEAQRRRETPRVAVVVDGPSDAYRDVVAALKPEVDAIVRGRFEDFTFPAVPTHVGDYTPEGAATLVAEVLASREIDLVIGLGLEVGRALAQTERLTKPVVLPFASVPLQGLPQDGATSGRANLFYVQGLFDLERDLRHLREVAREERVAILADARLVAALPDAEATIRRVVGDAVTLVRAEGGAAELLAAIPEGAESVYLGPLPRLPSEDVQPLIDGLNARNLPSYASQGRPWVERGALMTLVPDDELQRRFRRVALIVGDVLTGEAEPAELDTTFERRTALLINMQTARAIGVSPRFELLTEAELLGADDTSHGRPVNLRQVVRDGLRRNYSLAARQQEREIAEERLEEATGNLAPVVDLTAQGVWNDPDNTSPLGIAERQISYGIEGKQILYSPRATSGLRAARAARESTDAEIDTVELDVARDLAVGYIDVLRARTALTVNRENLGRVRRNLALAEVRVNVGSAGRQELFRWEIEIAESRANLIQASARLNQAQIALNRMVARPQEETLQVAEPTDPDTGIVLDPAVSEFVDDPASFDIFRDYMVVLAKENSPELRQLRRSTEAQELNLVGQRQELYVPNIFLTGGINHTLGRWGSGSQDLPPDADIPLVRDDFTWQVGLVLQFNVFDLTRYARIDQTRATVSQLQLQTESVALAIEQRVRSALHQAGASAASVRLRRDAAEAAESNLEMVVAAYRQGTVDIITLVDAQNQALSARLQAANAVYDFLRDFIEVERAAGRYSFLSSDDENAEFIRRLRRFAARRRAGDER